MILALLCGLAGYRVAVLLVQEAGPGDIFERVRAWAGVPRVGPQAPRPFIGGLLSCTWCCSFWTCSIAYLVGRFVSWEPIILLAGTGVGLTMLVWTQRNDSGKR